MPLISCPKCSTRLKVPDGATGNVKCPKCASIFPVASKSAAPAFEVVEDAPPPPPPRPAPKPVAKVEVLEPDFEIVGEPKPKKKVIALDDDEDDRPRAKSRSASRRDDYDDDDDDDRPRKKKKRRDYDDDDDWQPAGKGGGFGAAKVGMLLISISLWIYCGTFALLALFLLIAWVGASIPSALMIITGLVGLSNWIVALIGLGFCIAGPSRSRGLAIAATAVAAVHLIMAFVVANNEKSLNPATASISLASFSSRADRLKKLGERASKEKDPAKIRELQKEAQELLDDAGKLTPGSKSDMRWPDLATLMPFSDILIAQLSYESKTFNDYVLGLLGGLLEVARAVLIFLLIGSVGYAARDSDVGQRSMVATIAFSIAIAISMFVWLIVRVIIDEGKSSNKTGTGGLDWFIAGALIVYLLHLGTLVFPAIIALTAKSAAARRAR